VKELVLDCKELCRRRSVTNDLAFSDRYELEWAQSQYRQGCLGPALKKFTAIEKHFQEFIEDQFDFHTYCIRKMTLRAYVEILR